MSTKRAIAAQILNQQGEYAQTLNRKARACSIATSPPLFEGSRSGEGTPRTPGSGKNCVHARINVATSDDLDSTPLGLGPQNCPALRPHQELHPIKKGIRKAVAQKVHAGWVGRRLLQSAPWFYFLNPHSRRPYGRTGPSFEFGSANANFGIGLAGNPQFHISPQDTVITDAY